MPHRRSHYRNLPRFFLIPFVLIIPFLFWFSLQSRPIDPQNTTRTNFTIQSGQGLDSIAETLKQKNLIRSIPAFKIQVILSGISKKIQAGDFAISPNLNLKQVTNSLTLGTTDRWATFLEGWRREQYAQTLVDILSSENPDYAFNPDEFLTLTQDKEGQLYPDTYSFPKTATATQIVERLTSRFTELTSSLENKSPLSDYQALILASLIEREALANQERPVIAGILLNRYQNNWPLQVDASVQYVMANQNCRLITCDWWPTQITKDDINLGSPYNTYTQPGLPPSPISNPSLESLKAAYNPSKTDYWYYLHDQSGQVHFAKTLEEHNANIAKYLD